MTKDEIMQRPWMPQQSRNQNWGVAVIVQSDEQSAPEWVITPGLVDETHCHLIARGHNATLQPGDVIANADLDSNGTPAVAFTYGGVTYRLTLPDASQMGGGLLRSAADAASDAAVFAFFRDSFFEGKADDESIARIMSAVQGVRQLRHAIRMGQIIEPIPVDETVEPPPGEQPGHQQTDDVVECGWCEQGHIASPTDRCKSGYMHMGTPAGDLECVRKR